MIVDGIDSSIVQSLYSSIHYNETKQKFFEAPLYCKRLRNSSPLKPGSSCSEELDRPHIPGLPETERIKAMSKKLKKSGGKQSGTQDSQLHAKSFFIKPKSSKLASIMEEQLSQFEFSDYDEEEQFEDSKEILSSDTDLETPPTVDSSKRPLESPENKSEKKKKKKNRK